MIYRQASSSDFVQLANLRWIHLEEDTPGLGSSYDKKEFIQRFIKFLKKELGKNYRCFVAEDKNEIVSSIYLGLLPRTPQPQTEADLLGYITGVHTQKRYRSQGIGTELMRYVKEYAKKAGCELLFVWPSERAVPYYERLGFQSENDIMECLL